MGTFVGVLIYVFFVDVSFSVGVFFWASHINFILDMSRNSIAQLDTANQTLQPINAHTPTKKYAQDKNKLGTFTTLKRSFCVQPRKYILQLSNFTSIGPH